MSEALPLIPVAGPWITEREGELAREAALNAWGPDHYRYNTRFEKMLTDYAGVAFAASLPHATAGLHLALAAAGIGPGDEVIGPDVTWIASMAPVNYVGASPVFVDILPDTWCIDPESVEVAITPRTKAIIGVNLYGSMCDWSRLRAIAARHNLLLIEDAAESLGSTLHNRQSGSLGDVAVYSFHGSKTVAIGEGGMIVTSDAPLFARIQKLRDHGRPPGDRHFRNDEIAFKYKMSAVQAAIGIAQMERIDALIARKRQIFGWYRERLTAIPGLAINAEPVGVRNCYWMTTIVLPEGCKLDKYALQAELLKRDIDTRPFFSRLSGLPAYADQPDASRFLPQSPNGDRPAAFGINLPSGFHVTEGIADRVSEALTQILR